MFKLTPNQIRPVVLSLILVTVLPFAQSQAQPQGQAPDGRPPRIDFASVLSLDARTAQAFEQVMREHREKRRALDIDLEAMHARQEALRQETDQKLAKILTPEQLKKFNQLRPQPPHREGPAPQS
jgi:hypothetical protein